MMFFFSLAPSITHNRQKWCLSLTLPFLCYPFQLIAKSKAFRAEKSKIKEEQNDTVEKLDAEFSELAKLMDFRDKNKDPLVC